MQLLHGAQKMQFQSLSDLETILFLGFDLKWDSMGGQRIYTVMLPSLSLSSLVAQSWPSANAEVCLSLFPSPWGLPPCSPSCWAVPPPPEGSPGPAAPRALRGNSESLWRLSPPHCPAALQHLPPHTIMLATTRGSP